MIAVLATLVAVVACMVGAAVIARREQAEYDRWYAAAQSVSGRPLADLDGEAQR